MEPVGVGELIGLYPMRPDESSLVLGSWKKDLFAVRRVSDWARGMPDANVWRLLNHVIDRITLPSAEVFMAYRPGTPTPIAWIATRDGELLHHYVRQSIQSSKDVEFALVADMKVALPSVAIHVREFNPFLELERR